MQAINNILQGVMSNSNKPIKFDHPLKLANQSTLNGTHVIKISQRHIQLLFLILQCRQKRVNW